MGRGENPGGGEDAGHDTAGAILASPPQGRQSPGVPPGIGRHADGAAGVLLAWLAEGDMLMGVAVSPSIKDEQAEAPHEIPP